MKNLLFIATLSLCFLYGCNKASKSKQEGKENNSTTLTDSSFAPANSKSKKDTIIVVEECVSQDEINALFEPVNVKKIFHIDSLDAESPKLEIEISVMSPKEDGTEFAKNIIPHIVREVFNYEGCSIEEAIDSTINKQKNEYYSLSNDYLNEKSIDPSSPQYNHDYNIICKVEGGYKGTINYNINNWGYCGGAHGWGNTGNIVINKKTGEKVTLQTLLEEGREAILLEKITNSLCKKFGVSSVEQLKEEGYIFDFADIFVPNNFLFKKDSVEFIYNQYEIAPYSAGEIKVSLGYNELNEIIK